MQPSLLLALLNVLVLLSLVKGNCEVLEETFSSFALVDLLRNSEVRSVSPTSIPGRDVPGCLCRETSCATPKYALLGDKLSAENVSLIFSPDKHYLLNGLPIHNSKYIALVGVGDQPHVSEIHCGEVTEEDFKNCRLKHVNIRNSSYIYIAGITFSGCHPLIATLHVENCSFIVFENCTFRGNPSSAVHLNNVHSVVFRNCTFEDNVQTPPEREVQFPDCYPNQDDQIFFLDTRPAAGALSVFSKIGSLNLLVTGCKFRGNMARSNLDKTLPRAFLSFGHGGAMTVRLVSTTNSLICIKDSEFTNNTAEANGGAIQLSIVENAVYSNVIITNCFFAKNKCTLDTCTGGVIGIDFFEEAFFNFVHFVDSVFTDNWADAGGVVSVVSSIEVRQQEGISVEPLLFKNCTFERNSARGDGTVLSLFSATLVIQLGFPVFFEDCVFNANIAQQFNTTTAAVSGYRIVANFNGTNHFRDNIGGGIVLSESRLNVQGTLIFSRNIALNGGGLAVFGRCLISLFENSHLEFVGNQALRTGGGIYAEYTTSDFIFSILNRACFLQYYAARDVPLSKWVTRIIFTENKAGLAGGAIFASDFTRCTWYGDQRDVDYPSQPFFIPVENYTSPFEYRNNTVSGQQSNSEVTKVALGTNPYSIIVTPELESVNNETVLYSFGEQVTFRLATLDQFQNFREGIFVAEGPIVDEPIGAVSSNNTYQVYNIPSRLKLKEINYKRNEVNSINLHFQVKSTSSLVVPANINITIAGCHPGYKLSETDETCECCDNRRFIVRCDLTNRYIFVQEGLYVLESNNSSCDVSFHAASPGFLTCTQDGNLPGCLFKFDNITSQCAPGREGLLCSQCKRGFGITLDLQSCLDNCGPWGIFLFVTVCILTVVFSLLLLIFDVQIPNPLKGVIFFAQVIGLIYRNSTYVGQEDDVWDGLLQFLVNMLGISIPFPVCFYRNAPPMLIAWLGIIPPLLALVTAIVYLTCLRRLRVLYNRSTGLHGFQFLCLFVYKYFLDTGFTLINCRSINNSWIFAFSGESCYNPHVLISFIAGIILIVVFTFVIPGIALIFIYNPQKYIQLHDAFTRGIKDKRRYLWYGIWDIWRRTLFLAANLPYAAVSVIVVIDAFLVLLVLVIHCAVKPYQKSYINITEALILFCLFGGTIAILDENDIYIGRRVSIFFVLAPFIYGLLFLIYRLLKILFLGKLMDRFEMKQMLSDKVKEARQKLYLVDNDKTTEIQNSLQVLETPHYREPLIDDDTSIVVL